MHFRTFRLQPPHAPPSRLCSSVRAGLAPGLHWVAPGGSSDFALFQQSRQSHVAESSLCRSPRGPQFYGLSFRFQLLTTPRRRDAVTFHSWREAPPQRDFHPPMHALSQAHWNRPLAGWFWRPAKIFFANQRRESIRAFASVATSAFRTFLASLGFRRDAEINRPEAGSTQEERK